MDFIGLLPVAHRVDCSCTAGEPSLAQQAQGFCLLAMTLQPSWRASASDLPSHPTAGNFTALVY